MLTMLILGILFVIWALLTCMMFASWVMFTVFWSFVGFLYCCVLGTVDLILLSPFILIASPFVIAAVIIMIVVMCKKKSKKKQAAQITFDVIE